MMELAQYSLGEAVTIQWAYATITNIQNAPLIAVHDALETAEHDPRSLLTVRRDLQRYDPETWQAIKCGRVTRLAQRSLDNPEGNIAARLHAGFSRQGTASHLQAILEGHERKALLDLIEVLHTARRVKPLGLDRIGDACMKATKTRTKGGLADIIGTSQPALAFLTADDWLGTDPEAANLAILRRILMGEPRALEALQLILDYAPGDWRWRFLFGHLMAMGRA